MTVDRFDEETRQVIAELAATPVGRRWLLKAGLGVGAAAWAMPGWARASDGPPQETVADLGGARRRPQRRLLHFALGPAASLSDLRVHVNGDRVSLSRHSRLTRLFLLVQGSLWRKTDRNQLTHFAAVRVPQDRGLVLSVHGTRNGQPVLAAQLFHAPPEATRALARAAYELEGSYQSVAGSPERLGALGLDPSRITSASEVTDLDTVVDPHQTAVTVSMLHPNVATVDPTQVATTKALLHGTAEVVTFGSYIGQMQQNGQDYATTVPAVDADGSPSEIQVGSTTTTFSTIQLNKTDPTFASTAKSAFIASIQGVRDTDSLGTVINQPLDQLQDTSDTSTWHQPEGVPPIVTPYQPPTGVGTSINVTVQTPYPTLLYGTYTELGTYSGGKLPLTLYNNYVRWVWVYVQYLKADGTNLSLNANATWPDTPYAQSVGLLPQIFTVLGIPIWDTNTLTPTLTFPAEATGARLMFCGLGNDAVDGGWSQYFPATAYPNYVAPKAEVLFPALTTGLLTIGVTTFALATDLAVAATWEGIRSAITGSESEFNEALSAITAIQALTAAETFTATVLSGAATYEDISANGGDEQNVWSLIVSIATLIPKAIFNVRGARIWGIIAAAIIGEEEADKIIEAIPLIGEIVAVIQAAGDVITLAEAIGETASSPWVIANEISLTYAATVTVSPETATWPVTGRAWRLEATIDGATAITPVTGTVNQGGGASGASIVVDVTAPFGGTTITWSFTMTDAGGNQVGTAVIKLANNDDANPPSTVSMTITELPAVISGSTVFQRTDTTVYDPAAGGYTWSRTVTDTGTLATSGVQEVTGVTISTKLGVAGLVWKQNDQYWLRGVPVVENGTTITLGGATRQGYARRPFLLFDAFIDVGDVGNHVLLEPDDTDDGYHVRSLTVDTATGALSWDPTRSRGWFSLPVSAAALHSSGRVMAIHTDSGRYGQVLPADTAMPPLARYTGGPGTQIGLLSSPTAMAITNPGIVIVLEAGASRLSAFDLNGHPVRYFGTTTVLTYDLPLPEDTVYLDVDVDGSANIYVLSYLNDGSQPSDYRIDVYTPQGVPLVTNSPGTNVAHFAVDFWRSIFAANYTALLDISTGQPRIDPALGVPEPSLSRLDPST